MEYIQSKDNKTIKRIISLGQRKNRQKYGEYIEYDDTDADQIIERISDADVIITNRIKLRKEHFEKAPKLKMVLITATGFNHIDIESGNEKGIKTANITEKNGPLAGLLTVKGDEDLMIITDTGVMIRTGVANISQTGRSTQGVKVMRLDQDAKIVTFTTVQPDEKDEEVVEENE